MGIYKTGTWETNEIISEKAITNLLQWSSTNKSWGGLTVSFSGNTITINGTTTSTLGGNGGGGFITEPAEYELNTPYTYYTKYVSGSVSLVEGGTAGTGNYGVYMTPWPFQQTGNLQYGPDNYTETKTITKTFTSQPTGSSLTGMLYGWVKDYTFNNLVLECGIVKGDSIDGTITDAKVYEDKLEANNFIEI